MAKARVKIAADHAEAVVYARGYAAGRADAEIEIAALRAELDAVKADCEHGYALSEARLAERDALRAKLAACRAAVIKECARVVERTPIYSSGSVEGIEKAVATSIRALAKETPK